MKDSVKAQAIQLFQQLEQQRSGATISLGKLVKTLPAFNGLLAAEPAVRVAFVRHVVETFGSLGARKGNPGTNNWFHNHATPYAAAEAATMLLRRRLPFSEEMFAEMLEQISGMDFVTFAPALKQLVSQLEKRAVEGPLSARTREAAGRVADGLLVKGWPTALAKNWGLPCAADRKLADRIQQVLGGGA